MSREASGRRRRRGPMSINPGWCMACISHTNHLTVHHVFPQRFFHGHGPKIDLCDHCHQRLERWIPKSQQLPPWLYIAIVRGFLFLGHSPKQRIVVDQPMQVVDRLLNLERVTIRKTRASRRRTAIAA